MNKGPKSAVFTTIRARGGKLFHLDYHTKRLKKHAAILGIQIPKIEFPDGLDGLITVKVNQSGVDITSKPFYQEIHMEAEGFTFPAPRWSRKIMGTKHGEWDEYQRITSEVFERGADVGLLVHDFCIVDGDRVMPLILDEDGVVWISDDKLGGVDSVTFEVCKPAIESAGFIISKGRLNERMVARAKEFVLLGSGMGAARLTTLDGVDLGDGSDSLQQTCIDALGSDWR